MSRRFVVALVLVAACQREPFVPVEPPRAQLPRLGEQMAQLPDGAGSDVAGERCLQCHSAEIMLQQHLTEKQWVAVVDKMIRWGTELDDAQRAQLLPYLSRHFGPDNSRFNPVATLPVGADQ